MLMHYHNQRGFSLTKRQEAMRVMGLNIVEIGVFFLKQNSYSYFQVENPFCCSVSLLIPNSDVGILIVL